MAFLAIAILLAWLVYSWKIGIALGLICGVISLFYGAALTGETQAKIIKAFAGLVVILSLVMVGILTQKTVDNEDMPKMCNGVQC